MIVPSLPGWLFSSQPPLDKEFSSVDAAYLFNELMIGLGFSSYVAQGGDIGSRLSSIMGTTFASCKCE